MRRRRSSSSWSSVVAAGVLVAALPAFALAARPKPTPCQDGRFQVEAGGVLLPFSDAAGPDAVLVDGQPGAARALLASGCDYAHAVMKAKRKFTLVKAVWKGCDAAGGKALLKAKILAPDCDVMQGVLRVKKAKPKKRKFTARRSLQVTASCPPAEARDPGRVTLRRLNRTEYDNTVRDLVGDTTGHAEGFPADDLGYGFDVIGDVLSMSPLLVEKYELAARTIVADALARPLGAPVPQRSEAESEEVTKTVGGAWGTDAWNVWAGDGDLSVDFFVRVGGEFELAVRAFGQQVPPDPVRMALAIDSGVVEVVDVLAEQGAPVVYRVRTQVAPGPHTVAVSFLNDLFDGGLDRNLIVDWVEVTGPFDPPPPPNPDAHARIVTCDPAVIGARACARQVIATFGRRAWRRPLTPAEVGGLLGLYDLAVAEGDDFDAGIGNALQAMLVSPHFLFRIETDPDPTSPAAHALGAYELASRLSYFLWSSMPDDELFARAGDGTLAEPAVLSAQVRRMLADPKAEAFIESYVGQWLETRALDDVNPDYTTYPAWDDDLKAAMRAETHLVFGELMRGDRPMLDLLDADFTYLNDRLAAHYGLPPVDGTAMRRVPLAPGERGGILTHGSVLTVTSQPRRTSPVKRGKLVLQQLLCQAPPPPPPGVDQLADPVDPTATLRERMEQHRSRPECQTCHTLMDPIGFGLEHFDGIGAWRTHDDSGAPIDAAGELPPGRTFSGHAELVQHLKADPATPRCLAERMLIYALGRGLEEADACGLDAVTQAFVDGGGSVEALVTAIVQSELFRARRGEPAGGAP